LFLQGSENGLEALNAIEKTDYDLLLIDCQMPVMNGYEATREIRRLEQNIHIPILAMTAHIMQEDLDACLEAGMDDHLLKPIDLTGMAEKLEQWLKPV
jgi:CheY-like chemotaxis protein